MNVRTWIVCALAFATVGQAAFSQAASAGAPLTVEDAISQAVQNQPLIEQAEAAVEASQAKIGEAESGYYPSVSGVGSYTRLEPNQSFTFPGLGTFSLVPEDNFDFHVGLNEVVYSFGKQGTQVRLAQDALTSAQIGVEQIKESLAFETAQTFYSALFLTDEMKSLDDQLADLNQHLDAVEKKEQTGSATKYDVLSTQVSVAAIVSQRIDAANDLAKQLIALKQLVGLPSSSTPVLSGSFAPKQAQGDAQTLIARALADRPEIRQALENEDSANLSRQLAALGAMPTLSVHAQVGYKNGLLPDIDTITFTWLAGAELDVPIFNGFQVVKQTQDAAERLEAARDATQAERQAVTTQVLQALQDLAAGSDSVQNSLVQLQQAEQALDAAKVQFDVGVITNLEYLDSQTALAQAKLGNLLALYHEVLSAYELREAIGEEIWSNGAKS